MVPYVAIASHLCEARTPTNDSAIQICPMSSLIMGLPGSLSQSSYSANVRQHPSHELVFSQVIDPQQSCPGLYPAFRDSNDWNTVKMVSTTGKTRAGRASTENRADSPDPLEKEGLRTVDAGLDAAQVYAEADPAETRRILRKIDYRLIPLLTLLYLLGKYKKRIKPCSV